MCVYLNSIFLIVQKLGLVQHFPTEISRLLFIKFMHEQINKQSKPEGKKEQNKSIAFDVRAHYYFVTFFSIIIMPSYFL